MIVTPKGTFSVECKFHEYKSGLNKNKVYIKSMIFFQWADLKSTKFSKKSVEYR